MAYLVAQRTRELGIRLALGASRTNVLRVVLGRSALLIGAGLAIGLALAFAAARAIASFLYGVGAADPLAFAGSALLLGGAAFLASLIPARRATRIAPTEALRAE
jgi:ABC-type antimicrobial peptide transport system permease subunit